MLKSKLNIIHAFRLHEKDTGNSEIQIALLTFKIENLTKHLQGNKKDKHSRRGLLKLVSTRRKLLKYLKRKKNSQYKNLILKLNLRK